jgi:hypothetical protein
MVPWLSRLVALGATGNEIAAITAAYYSSTTDVQNALNTLIAGLDSSGLLVMLTTWRTSGAPFGAGYPGGGIPFGTDVATLTGNPADDTSAISAGTGQKVSLSSLTGTINGGTP